jgi:flagellar basal body-associated protein FliL
MMIVLGVVTILVVVAGVIVVIVMASRQSKEDEPPASSPADFISPVSSGGFRFRQVDESPEQFHDRVQHENEEFETQSKRAATAAKDDAKT